ncbi:hypothetical protein [Streptomyces niveus]|uniref:hypothetical protein n=1 Tax=Streptomyces niveus TaxID=193462 RepID=UPI0003C5E780|nr:hypothetical protein [Streptomyces niveus]EST31759.1 hypothetical protein M877_06375 [Streptomyces niveus NCIMB 11891]
MNDGSDDVLGVITEQIETRFGMSFTALRGAVEKSPDANPQATRVVYWHGMLDQAQTALEQAEDDLLAGLDTEPGPLGDPVMNLAQRVNAAVAVRDGRALIITHLLEPHTTRNQDTGVSAARRRGPALRTSPPATAPVPATPVPARGVGR